MNPGFIAVSLPHYLIWLDPANSDKWSAENSTGRTAITVITRSNFNCNYTRAIPAYCPKVVDLITFEIITSITLNPTVNILS